uniref:Uncharacterized protein n=1 Tax=Mustela putorius furo TaxID=9669 RepID=M3YR54_MUSPF
PKVFKTLSSLSPHRGPQQLPASGPSGHWKDGILGPQGAPRAEGRSSQSASGFRAGRLTSENCACALSAPPGSRDALGAERKALGLPGPRGLRGGLTCTLLPPLRAPLFGAGLATISGPSPGVKQQGKEVFSRNLPGRCTLLCHWPE